MGHCQSEYVQLEHIHTMMKVLVVVVVEWVKTMQEEVTECNDVEEIENC